MNRRQSIKLRRMSRNYKISFFPNARFLVRSYAHLYLGFGHRYKTNHNARAIVPIEEIMAYLQSEQPGKGVDG